MSIELLICVFLTMEMQIVTVVSFHHIKNYFVPQKNHNYNFFQNLNHSIIEMVLLLRNKSFNSF